MYFFTSYQQDDKIKEVEKGKTFNVYWADEESVSSFSLKTQSAEIARRMWAYKEEPLDCMVHESFWWCVLKDTNELLGYISCNK